MDDFVNSSPVKLSCFATLCPFFAFLSLLLNPKLEIVIPVSKSTKNKIKITNLFFFFLFCVFLPLLSSLSPVTSMQKPRFLFLFIFIIIIISIFHFQWVVYNYGIDRHCPFPMWNSWTCGYMFTFQVSNFFKDFLFIWLLHL